MPLAVRKQVFEFEVWGEADYRDFDRLKMIGTSFGPSGIVSIRTSQSSFCSRTKFASNPARLWLSLKSRTPTVPSGRTPTTHNACLPCICPA
jgi:hypothetical protein